MTTKNLDAINNSITEKVFQSQVEQLLKLCGYDYYHTWKSYHSPKGFPDIVAIKERGGTIINCFVAELKSKKGRITAEQQRWLYLFQLRGIEGYIWRPSDWEEIVKIIKGEIYDRGNNVTRE